MYRGIETLSQRTSGARTTKEKNPKIEVIKLGKSSEYHKYWEIFRNSIPLWWEEFGESMRKLPKIGPNVKDTGALVVSVGSELGDRWFHLPMRLATEIGAILFSSLTKKGPVSGNKELKEAIEYIVTNLEVYLLLVDDDPAGYATIVPNNQLDYENTFRIRELLVLRYYRGKGYADLFLDKIMKDQRSNGMQYCILQVHEANKKAIGLYKKHKFKPMSHTLFKKI